MYAKVKTFEEAAAECAAMITDEQKRYFQFHLDYIHHHFGYGLYLRNHYSHLIYDTPEYENIDRDSVGEKIYYLMLPIIFPEFQGYERYISRITFMPFDQLNANYVAKYGHNFIVDIMPDKYLNLTEYSENSDDDFDKWYEQYRTENTCYATAIAEQLWSIDDFSEKAHSLGYNSDEIKEIYDLCRKLLIEKSQFVPLEILFSKKATPESFSAIMECEGQMNLLFSNRSSELTFLPSYVFKNRDMAKIMVSSNGSLLELLPEFCKDREIVITAIKDTLYACEFMDNSLWGDIEIAEEAARNSKYDLIFEYDVFKQFNDDDRIVKLALEANGANICYASERIRSDYNMAVFALQHQSEYYPDSTFESLSEELRNCKELAIMEMHAPEPSLKGFSDKLLDDDDIAELLIAKEDNCWQIYQMSKRIKRKYFDRLPERVQAQIESEL